MAGSWPGIPPISTCDGRYILYVVHGYVFEIPSKYRPALERIGRGAFGIVCSVTNSDNGEKVAIKKIRYAFSNFAMAKQTLREIKLLKYLNHENVIKMIELVSPPAPEEFRHVHVVTELMDYDLQKIILENELTEECKRFLYQILRGLKYIHSANVIHRDLKPSNLLVNDNLELKIGDFGHARYISENDTNITKDLVTRHYRPPELLLGCSNYTTAVDLWSVGCIFMEITNRKALFQGRDDVDMLFLIADLIGTPTEDELGFVQDQIMKNLRFSISPISLPSHSQN